MKTQAQWDAIFAEAHLHSWPSASLVIQNFNPNPEQGSRNIFKDDETLILIAAAKNGYRMLHKTTKVSFIKP